MFKHACGCGLFLCAASVANAGYTIDVILPPETAPGGYNPGEVLPVEVALSAVDEPDVLARLMAFDFSASDPALGLANWSWQPAYENGQMICGLTPALCGISYVEFNNLPLVDSAFLVLSPDVLSQVTLPGDGSIVLGSLVVTLPDEPGVYRLDAVNNAATDTDHGARIDFGFENPTMLHGIFAGGSVDITVIPEPATLLLLGVGGLALLRRRKVAAGGWPTSYWRWGSR